MVSGAAKAVDTVIKVAIAGYVAWKIGKEIFGGSSTDGSSANNSEECKDGKPNAKESDAP